ncbi:MAG TPA: NAD(P)H-binding protein [Caldimonas sp.]|nr:NAD(P)H-binding protein [Caldimonas sp.]
MKPVIVAAATGRVGSRVCRRLDDAGIAWVGLSRKPESAAATARQAGFVPRHGRWAEADLEQPESVRERLADAAAFFLATPDHRRQDEVEIRLIDAASSAGVSHIVKLSAQSARLTPPASFGRLHARSEEALRTSGAKFTILQPVFFLQSLLLFAKPVRGGTLPVAAGAGRVAFVDADDVAGAAVAVLSEPGAHHGKSHVLTGPQAHSFGDVAAALSQRLGHPVRHVSPQRLLARLVLPFLTGMPRWQAHQVVDLLAAIARDAQAVPSDAVRALTGRPPRSLGDFLDREIAVFR